MFSLFNSTADKEGNAQNGKSVDTDFQNLSLLRQLSRRDILKTVKLISRISSVLNALETRSKTRGRNSKTNKEEKKKKGGGGNNRNVRAAVKRRIMSEPLIK